MATNTSARLEGLFAQPSGEFMPVPWWAWTGELHEERLRKQLLLMYDQGIREFFIFPIYGMDVEYMSDEYLDAIEMVVGWCRELGMRTWIYDEFNWPSGMAAGRVARNHPDAVAANLHIERHSDASAADLAELRDDPTVVHVAVVEPDGAVRGVTGSSPTGKADLIVYRRVRDESVRLTDKGSPWCKCQPGMPDVLSRRACRAFIDEAYEPVAARLRAEFGGTIKGFFTDEPQNAPGDVPWTDELPERFALRYGYDLVPLLHDLSFDTTSSERTRRDYWSLVAEMLSEAFTGQIADWCEEHGLLLTGHMVCEEDSQGVWQTGDIASHLRRMHVPGCDLLGLQNSFDDGGPWSPRHGMRGLIKTPKNASSSARFSGRQRVMCEAYGVPPWTRCMAEEKRMTDWLAALGVNLFNDNSLITSIAGFRKRAISGKHFTQPWWPDARLFYTYAGRMSALTANSVLDTNLLVLYPSTTWWSMVVRGQEASSELRQLELALDQALDSLVRKHWHFEFLYEDVLDTARVADGALVTDSGSFTGIVLAGIGRLSTASARRLEEFSAAGRTVVIVGDDPEILADEGGRKLGLPSAIRLQEWAEPSFPSELDRALGDRMGRTWHIGGPKASDTISAARLAPDGRSLLFVANMTPGDKQLQVSWSGDWEVELWDAGSGHRWKPRQSPNRCDLCLPEGESVWVVRHMHASGVADDPPPHFLKADGPGVTLGGPWQFRIDRPNLYALPVKLKPDVEGRYSPDSSELRADDSWIAVTEGDAGIPLEPEAMKHYWLCAEFELTSPIADLRVIVDSDDFEAAYLNDCDLGQSVPVCVWDDENRAWDIGSKAVVGRNRLLLRANPSAYSSRNIKVFRTDIVEPLALGGMFAVDEGSGILSALPSQIEVGDWRRKGLPHFGGTGIYEACFDWPYQTIDAFVSCDAGRDLVEAEIDGESLGRRAWGRRSFLARRLSPGPHTLRISVTNTLGGLLRRGYGGDTVHPVFPSGLMSPVVITSLQSQDRIPLTE